MRLFLLVGLQSYQLILFRVFRVVRG